MQKKAPDIGVSGDCFFDKFLVSLGGLLGMTHVIPAHEISIM